MIFRDMRQSINRFLVDFSLRYMTDSQGDSLPGGPLVGHTHFDADSNLLQSWNGSSWQSLALDHYLFDFDAHASVEAFPPHHIIGQQGFTAEAEEGMHLCSTLIGVGPHQDRNLILLDSFIDLLYDRLSPLNSIKLISMDDGIEYADNQLGIMGGTTVLPVAKTDARTLQFIAVDLHCANSKGFGSQTLTV